METLTTKKLKTQEEVETQVLAYINKTSQHLFANEKGDLMKILPFKSNGKWYYAKVTFGNTPQVEIQEVVSKAAYELYGNGLLAVIKANIFHPSVKWHSIPNFKASKALMDKVRWELQAYDGPKTLTADLKALILYQIKEANITKL